MPFQETTKQDTAGSIIRRAVRTYHTRLQSKSI